jgi:mannose-6-phosphate isomerase-like protein (cupin superfamily)
MHQNIVKNWKWDLAIIARMAKSVGEVSTQFAAEKIAEGVFDMTSMAPITGDGMQVFAYFNGPTDQLSGVSAGALILAPGASPHPVHQHPEEEFLIIGAGVADIEVDGKVTKAGPGAMMYCAGNTPHGIVNNGDVPVTFYWSKWMAKGFEA